VPPDTMHNVPYRSGLKSGGFPSHVALSIAMAATDPATKKANGTKSSSSDGERCSGFISRSLHKRRETRPNGCNQAITLIDLLAGRNRWANSRNLRQNRLGRQGGLGSDVLGDLPTARR